MFEQAFNNIDNALWKDAGCDSELDYIEQTSWVLFLKYLHDLEQEKAEEAELQGQEYSYIIDEAYRWDTWAYPLNADGELDHKAQLTGDDLIDFVNEKLFPYLKKFRQDHIENPQTIEYKIGEIFGEIRNKFQSG
ncbi:MAG: type I restriction-modification system subunit M N-terminal domain-containing protein, partial [Candidatus Paceibacterota bacterium]